MRSVVSWLGLLILVASLAWLYISPAPNRPISDRINKPREPGEPFSLVILDPGHGGDDSGALVDGVAEKDLALDVAKRTERLVQAHGLQTLLTRDGDRYVSLAARAAAANRERDCIFVSIHFNNEKKPTVTGVETYYAMRQNGRSPAYWSWLPFLQKTTAEPGNIDSQSLAGFIQEALVAHTQAVNRGTKAEQFFVIANVSHPAVLVEGGFLTNKSEVEKLGNDGYREQIATAISEGIMRYRDVIRRTPARLAVASGDR
jgi:N-acetylmuramoyl-L-alanine amidase